MPWYYAGPEETPVGPVSTEELHARRRSGLLSAQTYVIEWNDVVGAVGGWKFYSEIFPVVPPMGPLPMVPPAPPTTAPKSSPGTTAGPHSYYPPPSPPVSQPHPLFPSVGHAPAPVAPGVPNAAPHGQYPARKTNGWCAWGFGLGLAGFISSIFCVGLLLAVPALLICIIGFAKVQSRPEQSGRGLAVAGGVLALLAIIISLGLGAWLVPSFFKNHEWSVTEQSSTNSE
jgi:hypothetical protein